MSIVKQITAETKARDKRVIEHARNGLTMMEIVDREGLDAGNVKGWHKLVREAGIKIETGRVSKRPIGLKASNYDWRYRVGLILENLSQKHSMIEISRLVGMTAREYASATKDRRDHNWTISQLQRLGDAAGISFNDLITQATSIKPVRPQP